MGGLFEGNKWLLSAVSRRVTKHKWMCFKSGVPLLLLRQNLPQKWLLSWNWVVVFPAKQWQIRLLLFRTACWDLIFILSCKLIHCGCDWGSLLYFWECLPWKMVKLPHQKKKVSLNSHHKIFATFFYFQNKISTSLTPHLHCKHLWAATSAVRFLSRGNITLTQSLEVAVNRLPGYI